MVKVACPACAKVLRFQEKYLGRKIHCPQCGHPQVLGQPAEDLDDTQGVPAVSVPNANRSEALAEKIPRTIPVNMRLSSKPKAAIDDAEAPTGSFLRPPEAPDEIGRLGGYRILGQLGAGGMGVVFLAEDLTLHRKIALKVLPPDANDDPGARDRFQREAKAAAHLEHENIITIHQVGEDRGVLFLAMPLLKGKPLDEYLAEHEGRPLPIDEVMRIGREIAAGLSAAHDEGIVHRDIKPANIWLEDLAGRSSSNRPYRIKILDFGLARRTQETTAITQTGIIVGTPSYMSPEQARGPKVDARSDLFSLGCVLYEASTGRRPFSGNDAMSVLSSLAADVPLPPAEINPEAPFEFSDLIVELLEKNPDHRPASARDVEERLRLLELGSGESTQTVRLPASKLKLPRKKAAPSQRWLWVAGGSAAVCVVIGLTAWGIVASTSAPPLPRPVKDKAAKDGKKIEPKHEEIQPLPALPKFDEDNEKKRRDDEEFERRERERMQKDRDKERKDMEWKDKKGKKDF